MMKVMDVLEKINRLDNISETFLKARMPGATEDDIKDAVELVKSGWPHIYINEYKNYLCGLKVEEKKQ